jgi:hypothetical protein
MTPFLSFLASLEVVVIGMLGPEKSFPAELLTGKPLSLFPFVGGKKSTQFL